MVAGLEAIAKQLPFSVLGIDSDNDSVFINDMLTRYCADRGIEFTRSRAYRKNDQAWVEQKNGAVIRRFLGHERYSGQVAEQTIAHLHGAMRLYVNYFQPSFKLMEKTRNGSAVIKRYSPPATPCDRVIRREAVSAEAKMKLAERRGTLDPVALLHTIREGLSALTAIVSPELRPTPRGESLERFLAKLPDRWREEQEPNDREPRVKPPRHWRTRKDPFEGVGCDVLDGYRKTRTPVRWRCWAGCRQSIRTGSAGRTWARYSAGCNSGEALWQTGWSTPRRKLRCRTRPDCRKWRWRRAIQSAEFSVTFSGEATGCKGCRSSAKMSHSP